MAADPISYCVKNIYCVEDSHHRPYLVITTPISSSRKLHLGKKLCPGSTHFLRRVASPGHGVPVSKFEPSHRRCHNELSLPAPCP